MILPYYEIDKFTPSLARKYESLRIRFYNKGYEHFHRGIWWLDQENTARATHYDRKLSFFSLGKELYDLLNMDKIVYYKAKSLTINEGRKMKKRLFNINRKERVFRKIYITQLDIDNLLACGYEIKFEDIEKKVWERKREVMAAFYAHMRWGLENGGKRKKEYLLQRIRDRRENLEAHPYIMLLESLHVKYMLDVWDVLEGAGGTVKGVFHDAFLIQRPSKEVKEILNDYNFRRKGL